MAHRGRKNADDALAMELAQGATLRAGAAAAGLAERTASRRWADPEFRQRVAALRGEMIGRAMGNMADAMAEAAAGLRGLIVAESETVRLGACRAILELGVRLREAVELESRIVALEQREAARSEA